MATGTIGNTLSVCSAVSLVPIYHHKASDLIPHWFYFVPCSLSRAWHIVTNKPLFREFFPHPYEASTVMILPFRGGN